MERAHVARMRGYADHVVLVLHRPLPGGGGHVHDLELDLLVGPIYLVTVRGPRNPVVPPEAMPTETEEVARRLAAGRVTPQSPVALTDWIVATLPSAEEASVNQIAQKVGGLEKSGMAHMNDNNPHPPGLEHRPRGHHGHPGRDVGRAAALGEAPGLVVSRTHPPTVRQGAPDEGQRSAPDPTAAGLCRTWSGSEPDRALRSRRSSVGSANSSDSSAATTVSAGGKPWSVR